MHPIKVSKRVICGKGFVVRRRTNARGNLIESVYRDGVLMSVAEKTTYKVERHFVIVP